MAVFLSPVHNDTHFKNDGTLAAGYKLYTYAAGSTTPLATYTTSVGDVPQANPIVLNARGEPDSQIWLTGGIKYKFILKTDSDVTINPAYDNISGVNDTTTTVDQWINSSSSPTYISATSFSLSGDQTSIFQVGRRVKATTSGGTIYGTISASVFSTLTTVTVVNDSGSLDSGLSAVSYGILTPTNVSYPNTIAPLNSPTFTGSPSLPTGTTGVTQSAGDNSTKLATTAWATTATALVHNTGNETIAGVKTFSSSPILPRMLSTGNSITSAGSLTLAHGLGSKPNFKSYSIVCGTAEAGYSVGDELDVFPTYEFNGTLNSGFTAWADTTNINIRFTSAANTFFVHNKTTGALVTLTNANWTLTVRAGM